MWSATASSNVREPLAMADMTNKDGDTALSESVFTVQVWG